MDALPIQEATDLPYASEKTMRDIDGVEKPVMHACGHDMHVTALLAAATLIHAMRAHWRGTLITLFQPAEERGSGAQSMLDDGLYDVLPRPDVVFAQHVDATASGTLFVVPGPFLAAFDAMTIQIYGRGGHAALKDRCISPIVIGAKVVARLQTISQDLPLGAEAIVACGSIHAGSAVNIIPDTLEMKLSIRTFDPSVREKTLDAIRHIVESECVAAGAERKPRITFTERVPPTINDEALAAGLSNSFAGYFGKDLVVGTKAPASEDFSFLATAVGAPYVMWAFGGTERRTYEDAVRDGTVDHLPTNHSSLFAPAVESTLRVGVDALGLAVLMVLGK
jgi:amidohydrolase